MISRRKLLSASGGVAALLSSGALKPAAAGTEETQVTAAAAVLKRTLGGQASDFSFKLIPAENGRPIYRLSASNGKVFVEGSSAVAMCRAAYSYLRGSNLGMITWSGTRLVLPPVLPDHPPVTVASPYRFTQYLNPCTFGYSTAFWDWTRWERELDWMALHGINMPLALVGQEAIWQRVWRSFGVTEREWNEFTTGPAHLPWHRMGNINHFDGPLPQAWIDQTANLQKKILTRMIELGMTPVVPGFAGHVPQAFRRLYPNRDIFTLLWSPEAASTLPRDTRTFLLHPKEADLFREIGRRFIVEYKREFGGGEYYLADPFNELKVPVHEATRYEDLKQFGQNIHGGVKAGDPNGKWVMQAWLFANDPQFWDEPSTAAFLSGIPNDDLLIIDYASDMDSVHLDEYHNAPDAWKRLSAFHGKPWVNGMAHTFGGNNNVKGNLPFIASRPYEISADSAHGNLVGWGLDMEGIETNEVVYELLTDAGWQTSAIDLKPWLADYCRARYGGTNESMAQAWVLFVQSAYGGDVWKTKHAFQARPSLTPKPQHVDTGLAFQQAVRLFASNWHDFNESILYRNDLIEFVAQAAGGRVDSWLLEACSAHSRGDAVARKQFAAQAVGMLLRIDGLLHLRPDRRLETWVGRARSWSKSSDEAAYYDSNSRLLVTFWGWRDLEDYASRMWSGLIRDYYAARWQYFFDSFTSTTARSMDEWEQSWLSAEYKPSAPLPVTGLQSAIHDILEACL